MSTVRLAEMDGRTECMSVDAGLHQTGLSASCGWRLPARAESAVCGTFAALLRFAEVAGVGARTAYGFGAVSLLRHFNAEDIDPTSCSRSSSNTGLMAWWAGGSSCAITPAAVAVAGSSAH